MGKQNRRITGLVLVLGIVLSTASAVRAGFLEELMWWTYTKTKHPIVLAHGLLGFDSMLGVIDYWPGLVDTLEDGGADVYVTAVSPVNSSEARGEQLIEQIETILATTGKSKVNIFGHSQGSLDARYVATVRPDLVASITSIGGPHGSGIIEAFGEESDPAILAFIGGLGNLIAFLSGTPYANDPEAMAEAFTAEGVAAFNANYGIGLPTEACGEGPYVENGIRVYSWSGVGVVTTFIDFTDWIFFFTAPLINGPNDGLVGQCDSHLGKVIRDNYWHNHVDEVNLMFGLVPIAEQNPKAIFRAHANRLKNAGL